MSCRDLTSSHSCANYPTMRPSTVQLEHRLRHPPLPIQIECTPDANTKQHCEQLSRLLRSRMLDAASGGGHLEHVRDSGVDRSCPQDLQGLVRDVVVRLPDGGQHNHVCGAGCFPLQCSKFLLTTRLCDHKHEPAVPLLALTCMLISLLLNGRHCTFTHMQSQ